MEKVAQSRRDWFAAQWSAGEFPGAFYNPNHPAIKGIEEDRKKELERQAREMKSGSMEEYSAQFELPTGEEGKNAALRASEEFKAQIALQAEFKRSIEDSAKSAMHLSETFAGAFISMGAGTKSVISAVAQMVNAVIQMVIQMAVKVITAHALEAGAGAASSQAGIPIIGPILALSAMGAMVAAVMGLLGNLGSAAGGYDIPSWSNPITQLHAKEMVLPAHLADKVRGMTDGGGGGGDVHVHVTAMDARSFEQSLRSGNDSPLIRVLREATRRGRI
jgi:hypothetical protein